MRSRGTVGEPTRGAGEQVAGLIVSVAVVAAVAYVGQRWTTTGDGSWYERLDKPGWTPPNWLFGPVWSVLYLANAMAAWLVWGRTDRVEGRRRALGTYAVQLALNLGWTGLFFGLEQPALATVEIAVLLLAIAWTIALFWPLHTVAAALLVPYLLWVGYATSLTFAIAALN